MKTTLISFAILLSFGVVAQEIKELKFVEETHDFGLIKEIDGPAEYKFEFTNTSTEPIKISNVRASCGCTTPAWTREPVLPGEQGFITAVYNPKNRPGQFSKILTVTTTGHTKNIILRIQGKVEPKPRTIEDDYPTVMGDLRTKYRAFNMGKVFNNEPGVKEFEVYNQGETKLSFLGREEVPSYIKVRYEPQTLDPKSKGKIIITYDSKAKNDLGFATDQIMLFTSEDGEASRKAFTVYADLNEYFRPVTPESAAKIPRLVLENRMHDFGKIKEGEVLKTRFMLKNDGKSDLNIRKTHNNCSCTTTTMSKQDIKPGESVEMEVVFDTKGRRGNQQKSITIYSNDPVAPVQRIILKASVQVELN